MHNSKKRGAVNGLHNPNNSFKSGHQSHCNAHLASCGQEKEGLHCICAHHEQTASAPTCSHIVKGHTPLAFAARHKQCLTVAITQEKHSHHEHTTSAPTCSHIVKGHTPLAFATRHK